MGILRLCESISNCIRDIDLFENREPWGARCDDIISTNSREESEIDSLDDDITVFFSCKHFCLHE